ncbi:MAG: thioesterase family protein [Pseudomonadota bacterium]|nr:thioesterase family protein [Pseudomonadota bacterium]
MGTLTEATRLTAADHGFAVELDSAWEGWGPAGGYLAAIALRAAGLSVPESHRPVTLSAQFLAKAERGKAVVRVDIGKPGGSSQVNVSLWQSERCFFQAQIWTTSRALGPHEIGPAMPDVPAAAELETLESHFSRLGRELVTFWANLECRPVEFRAPGGPRPRTRRLQRWYQFRHDPATADIFANAGRVAVLIDANIWAAHWRMLDREPDYAGPSLDLTIAFHDAAILSDWLLLDAESEVAITGIVHATGRVWTTDGRLVATGGGNCLVVPFRPVDH